MDSGSITAVASAKFQDLKVLLLFRFEFCSGIELAFDERTAEAMSANLRQSIMKWF